MWQRCHQFVHISFGQAIQHQLLTYGYFGEEDLLLKFYHTITVKPVSKDWLGHSLDEDFRGCWYLLDLLLLSWSLINHQILLWHAAASRPFAFREAPATDQVAIAVPHQLFEWKWHHLPAWSVIDGDFESRVILGSGPNRFRRDAFHPESQSALVSIKHLYIPHCSLVTQLFSCITPPLVERGVIKKEPEVRGVSKVVQRNAIHEILQLEATGIRMLTGFPCMGNRNDHRIPPPVAPVSNLLVSHQSIFTIDFLVFCFLSTRKPTLRVEKLVEIPQTMNMVESLQITSL